MTITHTPLRAATLLACLTSTLAQQLPYNPTYLIQRDGSQVYIFSPASSPQFAAYDITNSVDSQVAPEVLTNDLPFLSDNTKSFIPVATRNGLTVFSGECSENEQELDLWTYGFGVDNKTWTRMQTTASSNSSVGANYLSAAFSFPVADDQDVDSIYVFGGMCPDSAGNISNWATDATYSNTMLTISPESGQDYDVSLTGQRAAPIAEAGLTITPLIPSSFTQDGPAKQQNFVLIGGHTQSAFINMSQVALFSMPQLSWAFLDIDPADTVVEPRSGHTAVMSEDGSRIYVFGGWVGAVTNPAMPQLAILEIGAGYGGNTSWSWSVPDQSTMRQYSGSDGVYGHAATMLPGDVMMVTGGYAITSQTSTQRKRDITSLQTKFFNTSSLTWDTAYNNPVTLAATKPSKSRMSSSEKTGLGTGLGLGIAAVLVILAVWVFYARRRRQRRAVREKQLREMALGTDRTYSPSGIPAKGVSRSVFSGNRSASWASRQEQSIEGTGSYPTCRQVTSEDLVYDEGRSKAASGMLDVPNPNRGLRTSLRGRGPAGFGSPTYPTSAASGAVFTIEEEEERSQRGSVRRPATANSRPLSDPFKDPPANSQTDPAAEQRRQEVQTWVEDWASAAETMNLERSTSKANSRTYSNLSAYHSASSGDKSDRSNSNLSERSTTSMLSIQKSNAGTISRTLSQRSGSAGYALFSSAAAAMGRLAGRQDHGNLDRSASKRSISTGDLSQLKARKRGNSVEQSQPPPLPVMHTTTPRDEASGNDYFTPPESPIKDYKNHSRKRSNSLTNQSMKALNVLGSATKRVLTGTGSVNVSSRVEKIESSGSPIKQVDRPEMSEMNDRRAVSSGATFWKHKQGAKDWEDPQLESSGTIRRRSGRVRLEPDADEYPEDWDVETAIQQRVVQVMFTVPKEKLRVVNADNASIISRSDTNASRDSDKNEEGKEFNRMSRVTEAGESEEGSTHVGGSRLHPDSANGIKGKNKLMERTTSDSSGLTIGKAL